MSMNITGMASGIDVNNIIEELMRIARRPVVRNEALIEMTEETQELWRETNVRFDALQRSLGGLLDESVFTAKRAESSNSDVLSASVTGTPSDGTYNLNVHQLATFHSVAMGKGVSNPNAALGSEGSFFIGNGEKASILGLSYREAEVGITEKRIAEDGKYRFRDGNVFKLEADVYKRSDNPGENAVIMASWADPAVPDPPAHWSLYENGVNGALVFQYTDSGGGLHEWETFDNSILQNNNWYDIKVEFNFGDPESLSLYVDGEKKEGDWFVGNGSNEPSDGGGPLYIGSKRGEEQEWLGMIGNVNLYKNNNLLDSWPSDVVSYELELDGGADNWLTGSLSAGYYAQVHHKDGDGNIEPGSFAMNFVPDNFDTNDKIYVYLESFKGTDGTDKIDELRAQNGHGAGDFPGVYSGDDPYLTIIYDGGWRVFGPDGVTPYAMDNNHVLGDFTFRQEVLTDLAGAGTDVAISTHTFNLKVSDEPDPRIIDVGTGFSLNDIADSINAANIDVSASVVLVAPGDYRLVLTSEIGGPGGVIHARDMEGPDNILEDVLGIIRGSDVTSSDFRYETQEAKEAVLSMNGITVTRESNTIDDLIDGVTLELKNSGSSTVQVSQNTEDAQVAASEFVETYNETLAWIRALTDKDDGPLHGDTTMIRLERQLRSIVTGMVSDVRIIDDDDDRELLYESKLNYRSLSAIGIMSFDEQGLLQIDSAKLRNALLDDSEGVYKLFARESREFTLDSGRTVTSSPEGIARQLQEFTQRVTARSRGVIVERLNYLNRRIDYLHMNNERLERRLESEEKRLLRQFTFMETYISNMMGQSGFLDAFQAARADMSE